MIEQNTLKLVTSVVVKLEIEKAPEKVRQLFDTITKKAEIADVTEEVTSLQTAYLHSKIVHIKSSQDALHVAIATVAGCNMIISWNFKHIVNYKTIPLYNAVNIAQGYSQIQIYSPKEIIGT